MKTKRLIFRAFEAEDSRLLMDVFADEEVMRYGDGIKPLAWVENWILSVQNSYEEFGYGRWAVINQADSAFLGYCGLEYVDDLCGQSEIAIGYRFVREQWGRGFASEAVIACLRYGRNVLGFERIVATIDPGNIASIRVAEKAGMVYEKEVMYEGYTHPDFVFVIQ